MPFSNTTSSPPGDRPPEERLAVVLLVTRREVCQALVVGLLALFVALAYLQAYDRPYGWTRLIFFGQECADQALPRVRNQARFVDASPGGHYGYDGQFYVQLAIDPSLRDPDMARALDMPAYRARRIGLPAAAFVLAGGKPRRILQVYALSNGLFWCVLVAAMCWLLRPGTAREFLCLCAGVLGAGVVASMARSLIDLPAAALLFAGLAVGTARGGGALLAAAVLTRETSLLAAAGLWDGRPPWRDGGWKHFLGVLAAATVPLGLWLWYVNAHLGHDTATGIGNFGPPLLAVSERLADQVRRCAALGGAQFFGNLFWGDWLYNHYATFELLTILATLFQGLFLALRRDWSAPAWRVGAAYLALAVVLGPAVWDDTSAAARVLLPMTICFYLRLARERGGWFWIFFALGSLSLPHAVYQFWLGL